MDTMGNPRTISIRRGSVSIMVAVMLVPITIFIAVVLDAGRVWVARIALQNGVEAAAVATATTWMKDGPVCAAPALSMVSVDGSHPSAVDCAVTGTNRRGTVLVSAAETVGLRLAQLVGRESADVSARIRVRIAPAGAAVRLWPLALCADATAVRSWISSGMSSTANWTIYFEENAAGCGGTIPGNWGVLDFNGGANSNEETKEWVLGDYPEAVSIGDIIPGNPGIPSTALDLNARVGDSVTFALFDLATSTGNGATYRIVGFARARIVDVVVTGAPAKTHLTVRFEKGTTSGGPGFDDDTDFGVLSWGICSIDSHGGCP